MTANTLGQMLEGIHKDGLEQIARTYELPSQGRKSALVEMLERHLSNPVVIRRTLNAMPQVCQAVFLRLRERGGTALVATIFGELVRDRLIHPTMDGKREARRSRAGSKPTFADALRPLQQNGMVFFPGRTYMQGRPENLARSHQTLSVPAELQVIDLAGPKPLHPISPDGVEGVDEGSAQVFQRDIYTYWNYVRSHSIALTAGGLVPKRHLVRLNETMGLRAEITRARSESDLSRLHFMRLMMEEAGLVRTSGTRLEALLSAELFFGYSIARRTDRFFQAWKKSVRWNELLHLSVRPKSHGDAGANPESLVTSARNYILAVLASVSQAGWCNVDDLVEVVRRDYYEFLFKRTRGDFGSINPYYYYHNPLGWGFPVADEQSGWENVEAEFVRVLLRQPLQWLGLISVGSGGDGAAAFRLTDLGAYLFGLIEEPPQEAAEAARRVIVQPNFQIFALEPMTEQTLATLDRFADRMKSDRAFEYRLSRESVYRAQQSGMPVPAVITFLEQVASTTIPQNVRRTLEDWSATFERIVIRRNVLLLHAQDPALIDSLLADATRRKHIIGRPLPRLAIARNDPAASEALWQALLERGHLPSRSDASEDIQDVLILEDDGRVTMLQAVPDFFVLAALKRHSEHRPNGFYLSESSVRTALMAGESLEQVIARWERWHHGPLPVTMVDRIKTWGRRHGSDRD